MKELKLPPIMLSKRINSFIDNNVSVRDLVSESDSYSQQQIIVPSEHSKHSSIKLINNTEGTVVVDAKHKAWNK